MPAPLLPGPAEVYVGGEYVLSTNLPAVAPRGNFKLGLGVEQAIRCARNTHFRLSNAAVDSIRNDARMAIQQVLQMAGFQGRRFPRGKQGEGAIQEAVRTLMEQAVAGQRPIRPLGKLGFALRNAYGADVNTASFQKVADRIKAIRASQPQQPQGQVPGMPPGAAPQGVPQGTDPNTQAQPQAAPQPAQPAPQPQATPAP